MNYTIRINKRAKRILMTVYPSGEVVITTPRKVNPQRIQAFVALKEDWIQKTLKRFAHTPHLARVVHSTAEITKYKKEARALAQDRLEYFNLFYNFTYAKITIRNQKTRWGSCSRRGTLSFNYCIALVPPELADYVIVHELCHTKQMNHSGKFWELVAKTIPDYRERRRALRNLQLLA